jgi:amicyanin
MSKKVLISVIAIAGVLVGAVVVFAVTSNNKDNTTSDNNTAATSHDMANMDMGEQSSQSTGNSNSTSDASTTNTVTIADYEYAPKNITVKKGTTVTWTNQDSVAHTVTAKAGSGPDSSLLAKGQSYSYTFNNVGSFDYYCKPHPYMTGTVTVTE